MNSILQQVSGYLSASVFEDDENKTFIARILHIILIILLGAMIIAVGLTLSGKVRVTNRTFFQLSVIVGPLMVLSLLVLLKKGYVNFVAWAFVTFQWFSTITQTIGSNGMQSPALAAFIATILLAGFLISRTGVVIFGTLSVLSVFAIAYLESQGLIPQPVVFADLPAKLFILLAIITIATVLLYMVMRRIQDALEQSRKYAIELEKVVQQKTQAEQEISLLNQQLQRQVAELERFTYTVSHDLRSPLVTIKGFLGMLKGDIEKQRPDKVRDDVQRIAKATDKMDALLSDLLELSRVGRVVNPLEDVDLNLLVQEAIETLDARIRSHNVEIQVAPDLPTVYGDRIRLREVFENLIDNAAKYMGDQKHPRMEIGIQEDQVIFVRDNGLGIETPYATKVFGLFEKLNPTSEGTGIGLALVKRIVEVHGGKIWIESEGPGKGSTFCFTIPDSRKETS